MSLDQALRGVSISVALLAPRVHQLCAYFRRWDWLMFSRIWCSKFKDKHCGAFIIHADVGALAFDDFSWLGPVMVSCVAGQPPRPA